MRSLALVLLTSLAVAAEELPGFSFEYRITGDRSVAPFQVFDDGVSTFLQFRDPLKVPSIFVRDPGGSRLVVPQAQGNYHRIEGLVTRLEFVSDRKTATVTSIRAVPIPAPTSRPSVPPLVTGPLIPPMGGQMESLQMTPMPRAEEETRMQVEQLRRLVVDLQHRVNAVLPAAEKPLAGNGAPTNPEMPKPALKATPKEIFVFEAEAGQRLSEAVRRFAASRGFELAWDTGGADFEIRHAFRLAGGSMEEVLYDALSPFKLSAVAHRGNRVLAISRAS